MKRFYRARPALAALVSCGLAWLAGCTPRAAAEARIRETRRLMGVPWTVTVHAADEATGRAAVAAAFAEVARLETILSDYDPDSELSRLSAAAPMTAPGPVSDDLWQVLAKAVEFRDRTDGCFDPTVGPLTALWRQSRRSGRLPVPAKLAAALEAVGNGALVLVPEGRRVLLPCPGTRLDLGGIGMGYAADRALAVLHARGITAAMIEASGDVVVSAPPPGTAGWRIAVDGPTAAERTTIVLAHAAVTTSGDAFQAVEIDGRRYSHIVDPRTGLGVAGPAAVTVVAGDGTTADALATAASVLGPDAGPPVVGRFTGCSARFVWRDETGNRVFATADWPGR